MKDFDLDNELELELSNEESQQKSFGLAKEVGGERQLRSNEVIRDRLMSAIKDTTLARSKDILEESEVQYTQVSIHNQPKAVRAEVEEYDSETIDDELSEILNPVNSKAVAKMDLEQELPNILRVSLPEYILIEGSYTTVFRDFVVNDEIIPRGVVPLCIVLDGKTIMLKEIQATPDVLFKLKYFLEGFTFSLVKGENKSELNIYHYLGKIKILE